MTKKRIIIRDNETIVCMNAFLINGHIKSLFDITEKDFIKIKIIEINTKKI